jgi:hypothetical protein
MNRPTRQPNAEGAEDAQRTQKEQPSPENDCSHAIIGAAVEVQRLLGTGLLESAYSAAFAISRGERHPSPGEQAMKISFSSSASSAYPLRPLRSASGFDGSRP